MLEQVQSFIEKYHMLSQGDGIVVGVSGGADSVCLLAVLRELREKYSLRLAVVHVNHMIRGEEAKRDQRYVEELCRGWEIPCRVYRKDIPAYARENGFSEEEAGRIYRYQCFQEEMERRSFRKIAVAHNMEDLAETVIFHMLRGSGIRGMAGISPVRGNVIRPLLGTKRQEIEAYLRDRQLEFQTDATNQSLDYDRNRIRHGILREMQEMNAQAVEHICSLAFDLADVYAGIRQEAETLVLHTEPGRNVTLDGEALKQQSAPAQGEAVLKALEMLSGKRKDITRRHVEQVLALLDGESGKQIMLPYGLTARQSYGKLILEAPHNKEQEDGHFCIELQKNGNYVWEQGKLSIESSTTWRPGDISKKEYTKTLDYDKISGEFFLRTPEEGDFIVINSQGGQKKLSRLFTDRKIDREKRKSWPVIASGHEIIWAIGLRFSEAYKVTEATKEIVTLTYYRKEDTQDGEFESFNQSGSN
jgi:tRNA(Ile)-lysidine synthase